MITISGAPTRAQAPTHCFFSCCFCVSASVVEAAAVSRANSERSDSDYVVCIPIAGLAKGTGTTRKSDRDAHACICMHALVFIVVELSRSVEPAHYYFKESRQSRLVLYTSIYLYRYISNLL